jgi:hypothetical protein
MLLDQFPLEPGSSLKRNVPSGTEYLLYSRGFTPTRGKPRLGKASLVEAPL